MHVPLNNSRANSAESGEKMERVLIEENGKNGFDWYRVPGAVTTSSGDILLTYEGRGRQDRRVLFMRRSTDGGRSFLDRQIIVEPEGGELLHNPLLIAGRHGEVWLFWCRDYGHLYMKKSMDHGLTFGEAIELTSWVEGFRKYWPVTLWSISPGHGIQTEEGTLVIPIWLSRGENAHLPACFGCIYSRDGGESWECSNVIPACGNMGDPTEASIAQCSDGSLLATMRHEKRGIRKRAFCRANKEKWETPWLNEQIPDPVCSGALLRLRDNRLAFVNCANEDKEAINRQARGEEIRWSRDARKNLTLRYSNDNGSSWSEGIMLEYESGASDLAQCRDEDTILCFYEKGWEAGNCIYNQCLTLIRISL